MSFPITLEQAIAELEEADRKLREWREKQKEIDAKLAVVIELTESMALPVCPRCHAKAELTASGVCWDCREELSEERGGYQK